MRRLSLLFRELDSFTNELSINTNREFERLQILNFRGDLIQTINHLDSLDILINTSQYPIGIYIIKMNFENGESKIYKLAKIN